LDKLRQIFETGHISHAYIFTGPSEVIGERAIEFSKMLLCENPVEAPCGRCSTCNRIDHRGYTDFFEIFPQGASIKIDQIRKMILSAAQAPREGDRKIYLLHQAHKMTPQAQNALLKTLEEPISQVVILILTENLQQLLPTVISRCQVMDFSSEILSSMEGDIRKSLARLLLDFLSPVTLVKAEIEKLLEGRDLLEALEYATTLYRDIILVKVRGKAQLMNPDLKEEILKASQTMSETSALRALDLIYRQRKAAQSRGNAHLLWFNLIDGLQEVTRADNSSRSSIQESR
jgi:DNA polymerase-3 subunit delta'